MAFFDSDRLYVDHKVLFARGWTRSMVERFLVKFDYLGTVNHWQSYYGKAMCITERVVAAECLPQFQAAFEASIKRRKLPPGGCRSIRFRARAGKCRVPSGAQRDDRGQCSQHDLRPKRGRDIRPGAGAGLPDAA